jgi:hypothetical protein
MKRTTPLRAKSRHKPAAVQRRPLPNADELRALLRYDAETGLLYWRERDGNPNFNSRSGGKLALNCLTERGYFRGGVMGANYMAHRVIWKMVHDEEPDEIDHIDGDTQNNRLANLRAASRQDNVRNAKRKITNTSGCTGVYFRRGNWIANIRTGGKQIDLGYFKNKDEAIAVRKAAERLYGYHANHGRAG